VEGRNESSETRAMYAAGTQKLTEHFGVQAVEELRNRGLSVVGLWGIENLPNFSDGSTFDPMSTLGTSPVNMTSHAYTFRCKDVCIVIN
jgi:hypothetical protein